MTSISTIAVTTWLDPTIAVEQARAIRDAFSRARPQDEKAFKQGANNGKPLVQTDARGNASKAIRAIAAKLGKNNQPKAEKQVKKSWSQIFKKG